MSRVGRTPIVIPDNITVQQDGKTIQVKGPKGELSLVMPYELEMEIKDKEICVTRKNEAKKTKALHGTFRTLVNNNITGVTQGYTRRLELIGTGYRVNLQGKDLHLALGFSHTAVFKAIEGIQFTVEGQNKIIVEGINKHLVGQVAANIRALRSPEPYKGKGIRYEGEIILKKAGKAGKAEK